MNEIDREACKERAVIMEFDGGLSRAETERLITHVARHYGCSPAEVEKMREVASRDIDGAFTAYRAMAAEIEAKQDTGAAQARAIGMVLCKECLLLVAGRCMAAREGKIKGAAKEYSSVQDVFRRCGEYRSKRNQQWA